MYRLYIETSTSFSPKLIDEYEDLEEAQERAKKIIERNILAAGEASGKHYTVKFINAGESSTVTPAEETP